ncbi:MAG: shikimate kinase [Rhodobacteraceae bacterium]|nr:shikimate kinase [Paracoccaceae bacterium]
MRLRRTVVMVGMMGAGKTAVGRELARRLAVPFRDSDEEIQRAAQMTIAEIFARDGEAFFRRREAEVIARLMRDGPCVLSVGGGAYLNGDTRALISELGLAVWLRADLDLLWSRVKGKTTRPLLHTENPRETLAGLLEVRGPHYAQAEVTVDSLPGLSIAAMAERVIAALQERPGVLEDFKR